MHTLEWTTVQERKLHSESSRIVFSAKLGSNACGCGYLDEFYVAGNCTICRECVTDGRFAEAKLAVVVKNEFSQVLFEVCR